MRRQRKKAPFTYSPNRYPTEEKRLLYGSFDFPAASQGDTLCVSGGRALARTNGCRSLLQLKADQGQASRRANSRQRDVRMGADLRVNADPFSLKLLRERAALLRLSASPKRKFVRPAAIPARTAGALQDRCVHANREA
jgi:hypothetical protein